MKNCPKAVVITLSALALLVAAMGVYRAIHSPLFTVQVVEVADQVSTSQSAPQGSMPPWTPVDAQAVTDLAAVPVGQVGLFDLDLGKIEKRILTNDWIREVRLQKRFPQTLSITPVFREPRAVIEMETGALAYVDDSGKVFGSVSLSIPANPGALPLITGIDSEDSETLRRALSVISGWLVLSGGQPGGSAEASKTPRLDSISANTHSGSPSGFRLWVSYPLSGPLSGSPAHVRVDLDGQFSGPGLQEPFSRLSRVFAYLQRGGIAAREIWVDEGKKIVVKTAHGS